MGLLNSIRARDTAMQELLGKMPGNKKPAPKKAAAKKPAAKKAAAKKPAPKKKATSGYSDYMPAHKRKQLGL